MAGMDGGWREVGFRFEGNSWTYRQRNPRSGALGGVDVDSHTGVGYHPIWTRDGAHGRFRQEGRRLSCERGDVGVDASGGNGCALARRRGSSSVSGMGFHPWGVRQ